MDLLLSDIRALELDPACIAMTAWRIGQSLDTRALAVKGLKARPDVLEAPIKAPIIIAGVVRSGTTALHLLMSLDPQFQGPEHWLTVYPMVRPPRETWDDIPEYRTEKASLDAYLQASPESANDHMMTAEGIEESLFIWDRPSPATCGHLCGTSLITTAGIAVATTATAIGGWPTYCG